MALGTAFRAFFAALFNRNVAEQIQSVLDHPPTPALESHAPKSPQDPQAAAPSAATVTKPAAPSRSDAITLLAALQREARLIDLIQENLSAYSDAQVGAAARPCLTQCAATLNRLISIKPLIAAADGDLVKVPENATPSRYTWIGEGSGTEGKLIHHGWEAAKTELPQWTGASEDAHVIAPAQIKRT
jgi:hypothetical protein